MPIRTGAPLLAASGRASIQAHHVRARGMVTTMTKAAVPSRRVESRIERHHMQVIMRRCPEFVGRERFAGRLLAGS